MTKKTVIYQNHHPDKEQYPNWTIKLRKNHHVFFYRHVQQLSVTPEHQQDLKNLAFALEWEIHRRKEMLWEK